MDQVFRVLSDRRLHPSIDVTGCHKRWAKGLRELAEYGWRFVVQEDVDKGLWIRILPEMPLPTGDQETIGLIAAFIERLVPKGAANPETLPLSQRAQHAKNQKEKEGIEENEAESIQEDPQGQDQGAQGAPAFGKVPTGSESAAPTGDSGGDGSDGIASTGQQLSGPDGGDTHKDGNEGNSGGTDAAGGGAEVGEPTFGKFKGTQTNSEQDAGGFKTSAQEIRLPFVELDPGFITSTFGILAIKGAGKSYTSMAIAEKFCENDFPFVTLDPTGAWFGLRSPGTRDNARGYPVLVVGGRHADIELMPQYGSLIARYVLEYYPCQVVVDLSLLLSDEQHLFAHRFFERLYQLCDKAIHIFVDEADEFAPQQPASGIQSKCLKTVDRNVRRGRIKGIGTTLITQRSAVLNKNVLSQVQSLYVMRNKSPHDLAQVESWAKANLTGRDEVRRVIQALPKLRTGCGYYLESDVRAIEHQTPEKRSFDSSYTPKYGEEVVVPPMVECPAIEQMRSFISSYISEELSPEDAEISQAKVNE